MGLPGWVFPRQFLSWEDFKDHFRKVYIPVGLIKRKRDEFRQLK